MAARFWNAKAFKAQAIYQREVLCSLLLGSIVCTDKKCKFPVKLFYLLRAFINLVRLTSFAIFSSSLGNPISFSRLFLHAMK
jgi:hypothetical protein